MREKAAREKKAREKIRWEEEKRRLLAKEKGEKELLLAIRSVVEENQPDC